MATQPPTGPIRHRVMEIMLETLQAIKEGVPAGALSADSLQRLDECIRTLQPMQGLGIPDPGIRMGVLAHSVRIMAEDLLPHVVPTHLDLRDFPQTLSRIEQELQAAAGR